MRVCDFMDSCIGGFETRGCAPRTVSPLRCISSHEISQTRTMFYSIHVRLIFYTRFKVFNNRRAGFILYHRQNRCRCGSACRRIRNPAVPGCRCSYKRYGRCCGLSVYFGVSIGNPVTRMLNHSLDRDGDGPFSAVSVSFGDFLVFIDLFKPGLFPVCIGGKGMNGQVQI